MVVRRVIDRERHQSPDLPGTTGTHLRRRDTQFEQGDPRLHFSFLSRQNSHETGCWRRNRLSPSLAAKAAALLILRLEIHGTIGGGVRGTGTVQDVSRTKRPEWGLFISRVTDAPPGWSERRLRGTWLVLRPPPQFQVALIRSGEAHGNFEPSASI
jgi:hypothetical protein